MKIGKYVNEGNNTYIAEMEIFSIKDDIVNCRIVWHRFARVEGEEKYYNLPYDVALRDIELCSLQYVG